MRQNVHDLIDVEPCFAGGKCARRQARQSLGVLPHERAGQLGIGSVAWFDCDDVAANAMPAKREVANDIEDFMADEFVVEPERFLAQDGVAADDDGIFEAATFDQIFFHQRLHVFVENKSPRGRDFAFVDGGRDFRGQKLGEAAARPDLGAGDAEFFIRQHDEERSGLCFNVNRLPHRENPPRRLLRHDSGLLDQLNVRECAAVADRGLIRIHLDDGVVHAHGGEGRKNVLDGMHPHRAFADGGGALDCFQVVDSRIDRRFVLQILALEFDPEIDRSRLQPERDLLARMQRRSAQTGGFTEGVLQLGRRGHGPN